MSNFLSTLYYHIRYNHPIVYWLTLALAVGLLAVDVLSFTATAGVLTAIGATDTARRVVAAKDALFWSYRAWSNKHVTTATTNTPKRVYGYFQSANRDGTLNLQVIVNRDYQTMRVSLADLSITNPNGLAAIVAMRKQEAIDIDLYIDDEARDGPPSAVIWFESKPFNIDLITASVAIPAKNPPTDIVDRAFAEYNWKLALNKH